jgi:uridine kinase
MAGPMQPIILGVAGGSGSGKTTVVRAMVRSLGGDHVAIIHHDAYYRDTSHLSASTNGASSTTTIPTRWRPSCWWSTCGSSAQAGRPPCRSTTSPSTRGCSGGSTCCRARSSSWMGLLILWDAQLRALMDIKVFVDTDADLRFIRRLERDIRERGRSAESVITQYLQTVRPMHLEFVEPSKRYADIIVPQGGHNLVAVDMLVTKVRAVLAER